MGGLSVTPTTPSAAMRVLAWMAVCDLREQTARQIQDQLGLSAGSVSSAVRLLGEVGVLEPAAQVGTRCVFYRFAERGWECLLEARLHMLSELRGGTDRAIDAAGEGADTRLVSMQDASRTMEEGVAELLRSRPRVHGPEA
jgi:DNA-binding transcriptional regulator GbsR (MarR family)